MQSVIVLEVGWRPQGRGCHGDRRFLDEWT